MQTVQQSESKEQQGKKEPIIAFRCPRALKKAAQVQAIQEDSNIQDLCVRALRRYLGMEQAA